MEYDIFKNKLKEEFSKHNLSLNNKIIAIIFQVLNDLNIID